MSEGPAIPPSTAVPASASPPPAMSVVHPFTWQGSPWSLAPLAVMNAVLTILTLGIYNFWARTEVRRRTWSSVRLFGEPLTYHGTARELLGGFLMVLLVVLLPLSLLGLVFTLYFGQASAAAGSWQLVLFLVIYPLLIALAHYRARRYRLSRTSWRGIRGTMIGSSSKYAGLSWLTALAYPITLGWIAPLRAMLLQRRLVSETELGAQRLQFEGQPRSLYGPFALLWFGTIILLFVAFSTVGGVIMQRLQGADLSSPIVLTRIRAQDWSLIIGTVIVCFIIWSLISSFYYARLYNIMARASVLQVQGANGQPVRFELEARGRGLIWLFITNALITYGTLYVLRPVATARSLRYFTERCRIVGAFDPATLTQNLAALDVTGEGLAQAFDFDAF